MDNKTRNRIAQDKYRASDKGITARAAYKKSARGKAANKRHRDKPESKDYMREYHKEYATRSEVILKRRESESTWRGKARKLLGGMKQSTKRKELLDPVEWSIDDVEEAITNASCCQTGIPFTVGAADLPSHMRQPFAPSPDRIDNTKGYTKDNVQWVCWMFNQMKGQATEAELDVFFATWVAFRNKE